VARRPLRRALDGDDRNALDYCLQEMASRAPVVLCYGNHDRPGDLDGFARLRAANPIYVVDRPGCVRIRLATLEFATVFVLPYPQKAGLVGAGVEAGTWSRPRPTCSSRSSSPRPRSCRPRTRPAI
jgi:hypothetical protein